MQSVCNVIMLLHMMLIIFVLDSFPYLVAYIVMFGTADFCI